MLRNISLYHRIDNAPPMSIEIINTNQITDLIDSPLVIISTSGSFSSFMILSVLVKIKLS